MTLPEHELATTCHHGTTIAACETDECSETLRHLEHDYAHDRLARAAETGEYDGWQDSTAWIYTTTEPRTSLEARVQERALCTPHD